MWQFWLIAAGIFFVGEIITVGFLIFWLGIAALITMIVSFFTSNLIIQTAVFVISSAILIFATKPLVNKVSKKDTVPTNVYSIIGKTGIVVQDIDSINSKGQVKVDGELWSAEGVDRTNIQKGSEVEIVEIKGVKAVVTPVKTFSNIN